MSRPSIGVAVNGAGMAGQAHAAGYRSAATVYDADLPEVRLVAIADVNAASTGVTLTALNCNGNPLDPNPEVGPKHAQDVRDAIELAALLGVKRVVTMSGLPASDPGALSLGGRYTLSRWPENSSWDFVAVGRGHGVAFWSDFLQALQRIDPDMAVNIEHEDQELDQMEGLRRAAETLLEAVARST